MYQVFTTTPAEAMICPIKQEFPKEKWIDAQKRERIDAPYYQWYFNNLRINQYL